MDIKETLFLIVVYILSFIILMKIGFQNFQNIFWLKILFSVLIAIIITTISGFLFITIKRRTIKKELSSLIISYRKEKMSKIDKIYFSVSYLLIIPIIPLLTKFPFLFGIPLFLGGIYGLINGRMLYFSPFSTGHLIYATGSHARIMGLLNLIMGWGLSYTLWAYFPRL